MSENKQKSQGFYGRPPMNSSSSEDLPRRPVGTVNKIGGIVFVLVAVVGTVAFFFHVTMIAWIAFWLAVAVTAVIFMTTFGMRDRDNEDHAYYAHDQFHAHVIAKNATVPPAKLTDLFRHQAAENLRLQQEREAAERDSVEDDE